MRSGGGLDAVGNYDDAVYFGSAVALLDGRLPYRDFLLLQPPGITLLLTPFAALAALLGEGGAWAVARIAFVLLGGVNAVLAALSLRRVGLVAAAVGGGWCALSYPCAYPDRSTLLEGVGTTGVLLALVLLGVGADAGAGTGARRRAAAGACLGAAVAVKLFFLLPLVVVALVLGRRSGPLVAGGAIAVAVPLLPFFVAAPSTMWREVVVDQLGRPRTGTALSRLHGILQPPPLPGPPAALVTVVLGTAAAAVLAVGVVLRRARLVALLAIAATLLLLAAPSSYRHYAVLAAAPLGLTVAAVLGPPLQRGLPRARGGVLLGLLAVLLVGGWRGTGATGVQGVHAPAGLAAAIRAVPGCTTTLTPGLLLETDAYGLQLDRGCPLRVDPTGAVYDADADGGVPAAANARWQGDAGAYLLSGSALLLRNEARWFDAANRARLVRGPLLFAADGTRLHAAR